jgi:hypothetical protein
MNCLKYRENSRSATSGCFKTDGCIILRYRFTLRAVKFFPLSGSDFGSESDGGWRLLAKFINRALLVMRGTGIFPAKQPGVAGVDSAGRELKSCVAGKPEADSGIEQIQLEG